MRAAAYKTGLLPSDVDAQTYLFLDDIIRQPDAEDQPAIGDGRITFAAHITRRAGMA